MKKIIISINSDFCLQFDPTSKVDYESTLELIKSFEKRNCEVLLVHPSKYKIIANNAVTPTYMLRDSQLIYHNPQDSLDADVFFLRGMGENVPEKTIGQYTFLRMLRNNQKIRFFLNDPDSEEKTQKDRLVELTNVPLIDTYFLKLENELFALVDHLGKVVVKPCLGFNGKKTMLLEREDTTLEQKITNLNRPLSEYIYQPFINESSERRLVFLNYELIASREFLNRRCPWSQLDQPSLIVRKPYVPTVEELSIGKKIMKQLNLELGCVDFLGDKVLEVNGSGVGLIAPSTEETSLIYDLTDDVVNYVLNKIK